MKHGASSLAARLVLHFAVGSALIMTATGYALYHALAMRLEANEQAEIRGKATAVERLLADIDTLPLLEEHLDRFRDVSVGHPHLNVGVSVSGRWLVPLPENAHDDERRSFLTHRVRKELRGTPPAIVEVVLAIETTESRELLRDHAIMAVLMAIIGTAASALLAWFVVRRGLSPLAQVAARAERVTARRLGERLDLKDAPREVHGLAESINRMLERLEESFAALEQFSADIAHELRTPLNNLLLQTQVTLGRTRSSEEYREALHSNLDELERLQRMVADMLFLARADRGMIELRAEDIDMRSEVQGVADYFEAAASERQQRIEVRGDANIHADRALVRRALINLLSNAVRYSPPGSTIGIEIHTDDQGCRVGVSNPGEAMAAEELQRLFKRFARRDDSRGRETEGAGLGLAIVDSIMKLQGGRLEASSERGLIEFALALPATTLRNRNLPVGSPAGSAS